MGTAYAAGLAVGDLETRRFLLNLIGCFEEKHGGSPRELDLRRNGAKLDPSVKHLERGRVKNYYERVKLGLFFQNKNREQN
ncbi:hypothetical protein RIF29_08513 [Crotalaria pallida]|uniref:Uncharacterized protein n=1 Tax=Crotalaria pallida TaxID=3830 RepID=A0AAN9FTK5_CROPI